MVKAIKKSDLENPKVKVKTDGYNGGLVLNQYVHFLFCGNQIILS